MRKLSIVMIVLIVGVAIGFTTRGGTGERHYKEAPQKNIIASDYGRTKYNSPYSDLLQQAIANNEPARTWLEQTANSNNEAQQLSNQCALQIAQWNKLAEEFAQQHAHITDTLWKHRSNKLLAAFNDLVQERKNKLESARNDMMNHSKLLEQCATYTQMKIVADYISTYNNNLDLTKKIAVHRNSQLQLIHDSAWASK